MLLTKASEYALLSLIMISQKETPQDVDTLSTGLDISKSFLAKILQALAKEGIENLLVDLKHELVEALALVAGLPRA